MLGGRGKGEEGRGERWMKEGGIDGARGRREGGSYPLPTPYIYDSRNLHSQFAFSGASTFNISILLRPWDVCKITSGSTPISSPTLRIPCHVSGSNPKSIIMTTQRKLTCANA